MPKTNPSLNDDFPLFVINPYSKPQMKNVFYPREAKERVKLIQGFIVSSLCKGELILDIVFIRPSLGNDLGQTEITFTLFFYIDWMVLDEVLYFPNLLHHTLPQNALTTTSSRVVRRNVENGIL